MSADARMAASPLPFDLATTPALRLDLSAANPRLQGFDPADTAAFSAWVRAEIAHSGARYAVGGYGEDRALYRLSPHFDGGGDPRSLHLGLDFWLEAGTSVHAVFAGRVHSLADNARFGDYGPTVILEHRLGSETLYSLYGHLARRSLQGLQVGQTLAAGERLGWLGAPEENLGWPPHLHLQLIRDLEGWRGDYPGVCRAAEAARWLSNCPDPNGWLHIPVLS